MNRTTPRSRAVVFGLVALVACVPAGVQTLHRGDGIRLRVAVRLEAEAVSRCNVLEERHSAEEYERLKENEGKPVHLWRIDLSVYNGSGRELDFLRAHLDVESARKRCTKWDVPSGYRPMLWPGGMLLLHRPTGMEPHEDASETSFLLLYHDQEPVVEHWDIFYTFAEAAAGAGRREPGGPAAGDMLTGPAGMEFVWVPPGDFLTGSTSSSTSDHYQPVTQVRISRGFWLGKHEVTQSEWHGVMGSNPSGFSGCGRCPVENVSWEDAQEFIGKLNRQEGEEVYRLPTKAEWEYAARAGTKENADENRDSMGWGYLNSGGRTQPVGAKRPNAWGLHDMLGNVSEWVEDWYGEEYPGGTVTDPRGPRSGYNRMRWGGSWDGAAFWNPKRSSPRIRRNYVGFRLLREAS